jgi:hypothetical protein
MSIDWTASKWLCVYFFFLALDYPLFVEGLKEEERAAELPGLITPPGVYYFLTGEMVALVLAFSSYNLLSVKF